MDTSKSQDVSSEKPPSTQSTDEATTSASSETAPKITIQTSATDKKTMLRNKFLAEASSEEGRVQMQDAFNEQDRKDGWAN